MLTTPRPEGLNRGQLFAESVVDPRVGHHPPGAPESHTEPDHYGVRRYDERRSSYDRYQSQGGRQAEVKREPRKAEDVIEVRVIPEEDALVTEAEHRAV